MIDNNAINKAKWIATGNGAHLVLQEFLDRVQLRSGRQQMSTETFLIGLILTINEYRHCELKKVAEVLEHLPPEIKAELGINNSILKALYRFNAKLTKARDYSIERAPELDTATRKWRYLKGAELTDKLLAATLIPRPEGSEDYSMDSSGIWDKDLSRSKDRAKERHGPDGLFMVVQDASWGYKTAKLGESEQFYGYDLHVIIREPKIGNTPEEPKLIEHMSLTPAGTEIVEPSLNLIDRILFKGQKIKYLLTDRHYSFKVTARWMKPLRRRGIMPVSDLHPSEMGFRPFESVPWAAGMPYCPRVPEHLGSIKPFHPNMSDAQKEELNNKHAERGPYRAKLHTPLDAEMRMRCACPALSGQIGCSLRQGTVTLAEKNQLPIVINPPKLENAPKLCTQKTVQYQFKTEDELMIIKNHQSPVWGTPEWRKNYGRRSSVEGAFGTIKATVGLRRRQVLVNGIAMQEMMISIYCALSNMRAYQNWCQRTGLGDPNHPLTPEVSNRLAA